MSIDFFAIDFETACANLNSACSIGIVAVDDCTIVDSFYSLIKPPGLFFESINISIHGITPQMVANAPTLDELWPEIRWMFTEHCPVVAHNANFDMSVLRCSTASDIPNFPFVDSIHIAKHLVPGSKSLRNCTDKLNLELDHHHNALCDAEACAKIAICGLQDANCIFMWEYLAQNPHVQIHHFSELAPQTRFSRKAPKKPPVTAQIRPAEVRRTVDSVDRNHPLFGKTLVFTGDLSIERGEAMQMAVNAGASVKSAVSGKTDFLVVGRQDITLVGEEGLSTKEKKAYDLNRRGKADIAIIGEAEFIALVNGTAAASHGVT